MEVCVDGTFLPVSLNDGAFTVSEATVICRDLGVGNGQLNHYSSALHSSRDVWGSAYIGG